MQVVPASLGEPEEGALLLEAWSDAARAASIVARRARAKGGNWRKAALDAYTKVKGRRRAVTPRQVTGLFDLLQARYQNAHGPAAKRASAYFSTTT